MEGHLPPERLATEDLGGEEGEHLQSCRLCQKKRSAILAALADDSANGPVRLQVGARYGQYVIEAYVGSGGMADVYRARHADLGSARAIKVLRVPTEARSRLLQEGREQERIPSPNVVPVYDVVEIDGQPGLVMEYVDGPSLRRRLSRSRLTGAEIEEIAQGLFAGVAAAHARGVVHRDLKPDNVLLSGRDPIVPKIADFGLARVLRDDVAAGDATASGLAMGTPRYMAPEQWRDSRSVDARADIWSVGAVLYELVCGVPAFGGDDLLAVRNAACAGRYRSVRSLAPDAPERRVAAIEAALQVDREQRPASIEALAALWGGSTRTISASGVGPAAPGRRSWVRPALALGALFVVGGLVAAALSWSGGDAPVASRRPRLLVLPFDHLGGRETQAYLSDGMTEDVVTLLTRVDELKVLASNTSFHYRGTSEDLSTIALAHDVEYVLTGSLRTVGDQLRITSQLVDGRDGTALWSESFDQRSADPREVEAELADAVVRRLVPEVREDRTRRVEGTPAANLTAYDLTLRGRHDVQLGTPEANDRAREAFTQALAADPSLAEAEIGLGRVYYYCFARKFACDVPWSDALATAITHYERGIRLAPDSAEAYAYLGAAELRAKQTAAADGHIRKAYALNPGSADVLYYMGHNRFFAGDYEACVRFVGESLDLDPYAGPNVRTRLAWASWFLGDQETARREIDLVLAASPKYALGYPVRVAVLVTAGLVEGARSDVQTLRALDPTYTITFLRDSTPLPAADFDRFAHALRQAGMAE